MSMMQGAEDGEEEEVDESKKTAGECRADVCWCVVMVMISYVYKRCNIKLK